MSTKQIVVDRELHRQFHQDCVRRGVTMRSATEEMIKDFLGVDEDAGEKLDTPAASGQQIPMIRYGKDRESVGVKVHDEQSSDW